MAKYTRGPWEVIVRPADHNNNAKYEIWGNGGFNLVCRYEPIGSEDNKANACLIAVAPELLERLKITNQALQAGIDAKLLTTPGVRITLEAVIKYNEQVITKAE